MTAFYRPTFCHRFKNCVLKYFPFYFKDEDFHMDCCKWKIYEVLAACELYSLSCSLLANLKQIFYLCSCSQKSGSARMLANTRKDHSSPLQFIGFAYFKIRTHCSVKYLLQHQLWRAVIQFYCQASRQLDSI